MVAKKAILTMTTTATSKKVFLLVFSTTILLMSCQQKTEIPANFAEEGFAVKIAIPMGNYRNSSDQFPSIGNLSYLVDNNQDSTEVMILSQRLEKQSKVSIDIVAAMLYEINNEEKRLIVAIPSSEELNFTDIEDLIDLSVNYGYLKRMIEQWYQGIQGLGKFKLLKWENKNQVNKFIEQHWGSE